MIFGCFSGSLVFVVFCFCVAIGFSEVLAPWRMSQRAQPARACKKSKVGKQSSSQGASSDSGVSETRSVVHSGGGVSVSVVDSGESVPGSTVDSSDRVSGVGLSITFDCDSKTGSISSRRSIETVKEVMDDLGEVELRLGDMESLEEEGREMRDVREK